MSAVKTLPNHNYREDARQSDVGIYSHNELWQESPFQPVEDRLSFITFREFPVRTEGIVLYA
jgi:hypothetical protein